MWPEATWNLIPTFHFPAPTFLETQIKKLPIVAEPWQMQSGERYVSVISREISKHIFLFKYHYSQWLSS